MNDQKLRSIHNEIISNTLLRFKTHCALISFFYGIRAYHHIKATKSNKAKENTIKNQLASCPTRSVYILQRSNLMNNFHAVTKEYMCFHYTKLKRTLFFFRCMCYPWSIETFCCFICEFVHFILQYVKEYFRPIKAVERFW